MDKMTRAMSYLVAAQVQAIALIMAGWLVGRWLNENHPVNFNWYAVTFPVAILAVAQTFYVIVRRTMLADKEGGKKNE